jgi:hypothetical protein
MRRWLDWIDQHSFWHHLGLFVVLAVALQVASVPFYFVVAILPCGKEIAGFFGNLGPIGAFICTVYFNVFVTLPLMLITLGIKLSRSRSKQ